MNSKFDPDKTHYVYVDARNEELHGVGFFSIRELAAGGTFIEQRTRVKWFIQEVGPMGADGIIELRAVPANHLPD